MTNEELLQPRFKVIADYPASTCRIGDILQFEKINPYSGFSLIFADRVVSPEYIDDFPHLFKRIDWWEERKVEEMPRYVKMKSYIKPCTDNPDNFELNKGQVFKPEKWGLNSFEMRQWVFSAKLIEPATEDEYLSNFAQLESMNK